MQLLPVVRQGATSDVVRTIQGALCARANVVPAAATKIDGSFGPATKGAVEAVQRHYLGASKVDGVVGPETWPALFGVA